MLVEISIISDCGITDFRMDVSPEEYKFLDGVVTEAVVAAREASVGKVMGSYSPYIKMRALV